MKTFICRILAILALITSVQTLSAQSRRPIDSRHPLWLVHIDVWNYADPQKIIDQIPDDIKPYVCMNLSLSCSFDEEKNLYRKPRSAVRTYKSWASVCQQNGLWFTCQPASGGHTHIQDNDIETFEYFFKTYPNFLGWNYAEQFWGYGIAGNKSSTTEASRWALFAKLVEMSHKYGGFLTVSWCGGIYHFNTDPIAELKLNANFMAACKKYPEAILFLYKYTHASSFYNNESVCFGPFVSGLTTNYGVRYDNCGWNETMSTITGSNNCKYPGSAGIATVMEQTCVNGGAVWDGPELIWTEDFRETGETQVDGYTRRNWGVYDNFKGIWLDMWRKIIDGTMYIPSREEVVAKTKIAILHDTNNDFCTWNDLYDGLYKQNDPTNKGAGYKGDNLCYFKKSGRYGAIPMVTGFYDDAAKAIPVQVKKSNYQSRWSTQTKKVNEFNSLYPEVSKGDLYVNRYRNQLVTYTPYTYLNAKKRASASIPLQYNTCETLELNYGKLSSGLIREYADHFDIYLNNYRNDTTTVQHDSIKVTGVTSTPSYTLKRRTTGAASQSVTITEKYDAEAQTYTVVAKHLGPLDLTIQCAGAATDRQTDFLPATALELPKQPEPYRGPIIIEAEDMDRKNTDIYFSDRFWPSDELKNFAGLGLVRTQANTNCALRHQLKLDEAGTYNIKVRYSESNKKGSMRATINGSAKTINIEKGARNDWKEAQVSNVSLKQGTNTFILQNTGSIQMYVDQIIYEPVGTPAEKFKVKVLDADFGKATADVDSAAAGETVTLTITPDAGYAIKTLKVVNSIFYTQDLTIPVESSAKEISFTMTDDNMTIQPVFFDPQGIYTLDFTNVANGAFPEGWRTTDGTDVRNYPFQAGNGPRTFAGLTGYQGKALYWRNTSAEYGRLSNYPLNLEPGEYELTFVTAAWKEAPNYQVNILKSNGAVVATSSTYTATPSVNGNAAGNISGAKRNTLNFTVQEAGKFVIQFKDVTNVGGFHEFLLAECRLKKLVNTGIDTIADTESTQPAAIYNAAGIRIPALQKGLNIICLPDGTTKKVMVK